MQSLNTNLMKISMKSGRRDILFSWYFVLFILLILCFFQYSIQKIYGLSIYPDEFGYWASAAQWIGYDWSEIASLGSYYSYGYSVILCPILFFCKNGIGAYRTAVAVNMILQCVSVLLLWGILKRFLIWFDSDKKDMQVLFAVSTAVFYPVWTFYMQMTLTEALLTFLYVLICYLFVIFLEKPKLISAMLLILALLYLYFVHMRTVGVVIAAVLTLFMYAWKTPSERKKLIICVCFFLLGAGVGAWIKATITDSVYAAADAGKLAGNDYVGQIGKIKTFFELEGIFRLLVSCIGKVYYLGMASFGLFYVAVGHLIKEFWGFVPILVKKGKNISEISKKQWISLFLLLSIIGQILITAIFMINIERLDGIVYGRYNDYMLPVFIGLGVLVVFQSKHPIRQLLVNIGISFGLFIISLWVALDSGLTRMQGYFAAGISYVSDEFDYQIVPEFCKAFAFSILLMIVTTGCICFGRKKEKGIVAIAIVLFIEVALTFCLSNKYIYPFNEANYEKLQIYEYIEEYQSENNAANASSSMQVYYLYNDGQTYIDLIQFAMQEQSLTVIKEKEILEKKDNRQAFYECLPEESFLIVDVSSSYLEELEAVYEKCVESNDFVLFMTKTTE